MAQGPNPASSIQLWIVHCFCGTTAKLNSFYQRLSFTKWKMFMLWPLQRVCGLQPKNVKVMKTEAVSCLLLYSQNIKHWIFLSLCFPQFPLSLLSYRCASLVAISIIQDHGGCWALVENETSSTAQLCAGNAVWPGVVCAGLLRLLKLTTILDGIWLQ